MTPEGKVKQELKRHLDAQRYYYFMPVQTGRGRKTVDFLVCAEGRFIAIEAKATRKEKPTALQMHTLKQVTNAGGEAWLVCFDENKELVWRQM